MGSSSQPVYSRKGIDFGSANQQAFQSNQSNPQIAGLLSQYGSGQLNYQDALKQASGIKGDPSALSSIDSKISDLEGQKLGVGNQGGDESVRRSQLGELQDTIDQLNTQKASISGGAAQNAMDSLALGTGTGYKLASDQVLNNPLYAGLFGSGGLGAQAQGQYTLASNDLNTDRQALMGRDSSYGLTSEDLQAYGQASDNIARMFGSQGNSLAQSLADRGLAGSNGASTQAFSGLMGNQSEQLAQAQMKIAQNRIQTAMGLAQSRTQMDLQRQGQAGQLGLGVGQLANSAQNNAYGQNLQGIMARGNLGKDASDSALKAWSAQQSQNNEDYKAQQQGSGSPWASLGLGALGVGLGAVTGGLGSAAVGGLLGSQLAGQSKASISGSGSNLSDYWNNNPYSK